MTLSALLLWMGMSLHLKRKDSTTVLVVMAADSRNMEMEQKQFLQSSEDIFTLHLGYILKSF